MDRYNKSNGVDVPPVAPAAPAHLYYTSGDPENDIPATVPGPWFFHMIMESMRNVIVAAGLTPSHTDLNLLRDAIKTLAAGGDYKSSCRVASTAALNIAAPGANIDGVAMVANDRVLLKDQAAPVQNGLWIWNGAAVAMTRALDADTGTELNSGAIIPVEVGTANADSLWMLTTDGVITIGVTALTFVNASGLTIVTADARYTNIGYMLVRDEKSASTSGGTSASGVQTRTLNTVSANTISGASLAGNQITLPAGTYRVSASAPSSNVDDNRAYIYNVTDAANLILGTSENGGGALTTRSFVTGRFTLAATKVLEFRHWISSAQTNGLGLATGAGGVEVYAEVQIIKES